MCAAVGLLVTAAGCSRNGDSKAAATQTTVGAVSASAHASPVAATAASEAKAPSTKTLDLSAEGLALVIDVPSCAKVSRPIACIADNKDDVIVACEADDSLDAKAPFAVQVGPTKGKIWKKEMQAEAEFVRWVKTEPSFLQREVEIFGQKKQDFMLRSKLGRTETMCFSQFATDDAALLAAEIAACRSLRVR